jgi:hypothetical protein
LIAFGLCLAAITSQSLWIDEAGTATIAMQRTFSDWWQAMLRDGGSSTQMPLYMGYLWIWEKISGHGEWALRTANLPWIVIGLLSIDRRTHFLVLTAAVSPFLWFYLDEARPYAMQIGSSLMLFGALQRLVENSAEPSSAGAEKKWLWCFCFGLVALGGSSLLGMIWVVAAILAVPVALSWQRALPLLRRHTPLIGTTVFLLVLLSLYYFWTLKHGNRASNIASTGWKNVVFVGYELFGFAGIGPGRLEIRSGGLQIFKPYLLQLALLSAFVLVLIFLAVRRLCQLVPLKKLFGLGFIVTAPAIFILATGLVLHFRVLGRHVAPLFPMAMFLLVLGLTELWRRRAAGKIMVAVFFGLCLASDFSLRFAPRHAKDDYRSAATLAKASLVRGEKVWWNADVMSAKYYQLPLTTNSIAVNEAMVVISPTLEFLENSPVPQVILCSRPDIYDPSGVLSDFLTGKNFIKTVTLPAFEIWEERAPGVTMSDER